MREAIKLAIREEMLADPAVTVFGEDVAEAGGVFKVTAGLLDEFGPLRVRDTPISEMAIVGAAVGAAATGLRPVIEIMFGEFFGVAMDQVVTELARIRYLSSGRLSTPVVIRTSAGGGLGFGAQHSQTLESWFMNTPGLIVASPSGPRSAYSLTRAAIRSADPVILIEPRALYGLREDFTPGPECILPLCTAETVRPGTDITVVALGQMVRVAAEAAAKLEPQISCEVIDLGTVVPWDKSTVLESVARTGRLLTVEENPMTGGWGTDVSSTVASSCHDLLRAPVGRVTCPDAPVPSGSLERSYLPSIDNVIDAVQAAVDRNEVLAARWTGWSPSAPRRSVSVEGAVRRRAALDDPVGRYERMLEIRFFEEAVGDLFAQGLISGATHSSQGQEAVAVGLAASTRASDMVTCTYRGHGVALALGADPGTMMAEILGRRDGCVGGKGGSMHLVAAEVGLFPTFAIVGAGIPVAVGAALTAQVQGKRDVAIAVFGDGATNIGAFHEGLNLAAVWRLPVLFVCENNLYGEYSRIERTTRVPELARRAAAYGMPGRVVDGMDVEHVIAEVNDAVRRARSGDGPTFLEMKTYRFTGHSRGDPGKYRPDNEVESWKLRDPVVLAERDLVARGVGAERLAAARRAAERTVSDAVTFAKASPPPEPGDIFANLWGAETARHARAQDAAHPHTTSERRH